MSLENVKQLLSDFGWEYKISSNDFVLYSSNYQKLIKEEIYLDTYKYNNLYFKKKIKFIEINDIKYKIEYLEDVTSYIGFVTNLKKDKLTGLYTREEIENYLKKIKRNSIVVLCDIDDFKKVNDKYGHQIGDKVLTLLGKIIRENIRKSDFGGRYGGEEFLIIFDTSNINLVKKRIDELNKKFNIESKEMNLTFSAGISMFNGTKTITETIKNSDEALYYAKRNGKNRSVIYDESLKSIFK